MSISRDLLKILACPESKAPLVISADGAYLISTDKKTRRRYRIEDDIPVLLIEESEVLSPEDHESQLTQAAGK
ncbi:MAG: Trm112 family protein [Sumerlaeia bacterium]